MADDILTSIHGRRFGLTSRGALVVNPHGTGTMAVPRAAYVMTAAGTALTNTTDETALGSYTIPANTLAAGSLIKVYFQGIATATNSSDTLAVKLYIGGIGGTALITSAAVDVSDNNLFFGTTNIIVRTAGSSGTMVAHGFYKTTAAEGTATIKDDVLASTALDTTVDKAITVAGTWSVASASNSCRLDILTVEIA